MDLEVEHNLQPDELSKALVGLACCHHLEQEISEALQKAIEPGPKLPDTAAMRGLFFRFQALYREAMEWCRDFSETVVTGRLEKAKKFTDRPLTGKEIRVIQDAIRDRFGYLAAQMESEEFTVPEDVLDRWKQQGLIAADVTPQTFAGTIQGEARLVRNAFVFGRLYNAVEAGKSYEEVLKQALNAPLLKPDRQAIAIAEQQTANHITALGDDLAAEAGRLIAARNRNLIRKMAVDFHSRALPATVRDEAIKRELGMEIPEKIVDTWQGFSSELYHAMEDKSRDWDRIAFYELQDAKGQGKGMALLEKFGPEQLVYKRPLPTACAQCKHLYLDDEGNPRLFRLNKMLSWGNNIGRKPLPVRGGTVSSHSRDDGAEAVKPVAGQVHPWCSCSGPHIVSGFEPWLKQNQN